MGKSQTKPKGAMVRVIEDKEAGVHDAENLPAKAWRLLLYNNKVSGDRWLTMLGAYKRKACVRGSEKAKAYINGNMTSSLSRRAITWTSLLEGFKLMGYDSLKLTFELGRRGKTHTVVLEQKLEIVPKSDKEDLPDRTAMTVVKSRDDFISMFDVNGKPLQPFTVGREVFISDATFVTSLKGVELSVGCIITGLSGLLSLEGVTMRPDVCLVGLVKITTLGGINLSRRANLYGLISLVDLDGVVMKQGVELNDLNGVLTLVGLQDAIDTKLTGLTSVLEPINPTVHELAVLKRLPLKAVKGTTVSDVLLDNLDIPCPEGTSFGIKKLKEVLPSMKHFLDVPYVDFISYLKELK